MANYRIYQGQEICTLSETKFEPIVEGVIYENDIVMLAGKPKSSKTIFAIQLACNISSGTPFLDSFETPKPSRVLYIATEMKDEELKTRFIRTSNHVKTNFENITLLCTKGSNFKFNNRIGKQHIAELFLKYKECPPKIIFIDSVYKAFFGDLNKNDVVNEFLSEVDRMAAEWDSAVMLVHHLKKSSRDKDGNAFEQSDEDSYGSQFLIGAVDHVIRLEMIHKEQAPYDRYVRCDTQRSGTIISDLRIRLHQPDPLYFSPVDNNLVEKNFIIDLFKKTGTPTHTVDTLVKQTGYSRSKIYKILKELQDSKQVIKTGTKQKFYGVSYEKVL